MKTEQKIKTAIEKNEETRVKFEGKRGVLAQEKAKAVISTLTLALEKTEEQIKESIEENTKKAIELESDKGVLERERALTTIETFRWALKDKD